MTPENGEDQSPHEPTVQVLAHTRALVDNVALVDVRTVRISAELSYGVEPTRPVDNLRFQQVNSFIADDGVFACRSEFDLTLVDSSEESIARIEFALVADYSVAPGFTPDREAASFFANTTGYFAAFPFARELLRDITCRMSLDPVVLGLLPRQGMSPASIAILRAERMLVLTHSDEPTSAEPESQ